MLQCPSGSPGFLYRIACHTEPVEVLSHYLQLLQPTFVAATCVLHATSFITSFVPLHFTSFAANTFASRHGTLSCHTEPVEVCTCLSAINCYRAHWVPFR